MICCVSWGRVGYAAVKKRPSISGSVLPKFIFHLWLSVGGEPLWIVLIQRTQDGGMAYLKIGQHCIRGKSRALHWQLSSLSRANYVTFHLQMIIQNYHMAPTDYSWVYGIYHISGRGKKQMINDFHIPRLTIISDWSMTSVKKWH